jgi:diguanylate cyclase (GGDEF)-like protein
MRTGFPLGVLLGDVDDLNRINESHGTVAGDLVLREVAWRLACSVRPYDWIGRYGPSTFLVLVPGCAPPDIWRLGERLRAAVSEQPISTPAGPLVATISFGVATWSATRNVPMDEDALLRACTAALAEAKRAGQDRVSFAPWQDFRSRKDATGSLPARSIRVR